MNTHEQTPIAEVHWAETHWETKWIAAEGTFDPAYQRTTEALRRWLDGMEAALVTQPPRRPPVASPVRRPQLVVQPAASL